MANGRTAFLPLRQSIPGVLVTCPSESKLWAARIEKNALVISTVAYNFVAFDSSLYRSSNMSSTAALIAGVASFRPQ